jgi:hypothetical protein
MQDKKIIISNGPFVRVKVGHRIFKYRRIDGRKQLKKQVISVSTTMV